jgi:hypothetical protein
LSGIPGKRTVFSGKIGKSYISSQIVIFGNFILAQTTYERH